MKKTENNKIPCKTITLSNDEFDRFVETCEKAEEPNQAFLKAFKLAEKQGIR